MAPVFILGIRPRSGTNFLWDLLRLHPELTAPRSPVNEDFLIKHSDHLARYATEVRKHWKKWDRSIDLTAEIQADLGRGLIGFMNHDPDKRLLTKTPTVVNLKHFPALFPEAQLILLVRDGRAVVESGMRSFGWDFDTAVHRWRAAADEIRRFQKKGECPYHLVRYEELLLDLDGSIKQILEYLDLEIAAYDFEAAANLPVRGSSTFHRTEGRKVSWSPVAKTGNFDPSARWKQWSPNRLRRFDYLAGEQLRYFGYEPTDHPRRGPARLQQRALDARWLLMRGLRGTRKRTRKRLTGAKKNA
jgi:Sulfotransferase family